MSGGMELEEENSSDKGARQAGVWGTSYKQNLHHLAK